MQVQPGQIFGELSVLSGTGSFFEGRVDCDTAVVLRLPRAKCIKSAVMGVVCVADGNGSIMLEYPQVLSTLSQMLLSSISDLVLLLDYGLQWVRASRSTYTSYESIYLSH